MNDYTILIPVFLPAVFGILLPLLKPLYDKAFARHAYVLTGVVISLAAVIGSCFYDNKQVVLWDFLEGIPIYFKLDNMGILFAVLTAFIWVMNSVFAFEYMKHEGREIRYFTLQLLSLTAMLGVCYAGNLFTGYMFYEFMSVFTMPLVLHSLSRESIEAAKKYIFYSMGGAFLGLAGFFVMHKYGGALEYIPGGSIDPSTYAGHEIGVLVVSILFIIGFGSKAGMWPLHGWLPTAHPVAPAPASAILSGNITKMGVLMIVRYIFYIIGADNLRGTWVQYAFMSLSLLTVLMGSMMAYKEEIIKKRFAYSTVSQVSYVLFGLSTLNPIGIIGALMHVVFHSLVKNTLFLNAGAIIYKTGRTKVSDLRGIGKEMPVTMWCYTLVSLTLVGIPPTSAFVSKWYLALGSLDAQINVLSVLGPIVLLVSALLTAGYLITITMKGFFPGDDFDYANLKNYEPNYLMLIPTIVLTALAVLLGVFPGAFTEFLQTIVASIC